MGKNYLIMEPVVSVATLTLIDGRSWNTNRGIKIVLWSINGLQDRTIRTKENTYIIRIFNKYLRSKF